MTSLTSSPRQQNRKNQNLFQNENKVHRSYLPNSVRLEVNLTHAEKFEVKLSLQKSDLNPKRKVVVNSRFTTAQRSLEKDEKSTRCPSKRTRNIVVTKNPETVQGI